MTSFDGSTFFVKSQIAVLNFCHFTSFWVREVSARWKKYLHIFSVKSSCEVHRIVMFQTDAVCILGMCILNSYENLFLYLEVFEIMFFDCSISLVISKKMCPNFLSPLYALLRWKIHTCFITKYQSCYTTTTCKFETQIVNVF